jgi:hypothetical protein
MVSMKATEGVLSLGETCEHVQRSEGPFWTEGIPYGVDLIPYHGKQHARQNSG